MLFTVVESRDGRLKAESADRKITLTLEGLWSGHSGFGTGETFRLDVETPVLEVLAVGQPEAVVSHDLSVGEVMSLSAVEAGLRSEDSEPMPEVAVEVVDTDEDSLTVELTEPLAEQAEGQ